MATQSSYTTVKVSRFGFPLLSVTLDRVNTDNARAVAIAMIANSCGTTVPEDVEWIGRCWDEALKGDDRYSSFVIEDDGHRDNDYRCYINHFDITEQQRINAISAETDVSPMFF